MGLWASLIIILPYRRNFMDTVLIGGVSVLIFFGLVWLTHAKVEASDCRQPAKE